MQMKRRMKMSKVNKINYSEKDYAIVKALKEAGKPLTGKEISEIVKFEVAPGTLTAAKGKGLIDVAGKVEVARPVEREVNAYVFVTDEVLQAPNGKPKSYSDSEKEIMAKLKEAEKPMALVEIAEALGRKISAGAVSGIVKAGNIAVAPEKVKIQGFTTGEVNTYKFVQDIPTEPTAFKAE